MAAAASSAQAAREALERVLRSETLRSSEGLRQMLAYLAERSLETPGVELKEYTVGVEACGKPESYDPQRDASVRVQAGRLRKRLQEYYASEGASDAVLLEVPKGRFEVRFHLRDSAPGRQMLNEPSRTTWQRAGRALSSPRLWLAAAAAVALLFAGWAWRLQQRLAGWDADYGISGREAAASELGALWGAFRTREVPALAVIGSPAFYADSKRGLWVRLPEPAEGESGQGELDRIRRQLGGLQGPNHDFAAMGDALAVQKLTAFLGAGGVRLKSIPAHQAAWAEASEGNLILLGAWRMNPLLQKLPVRQDFDLREEGMAQNRNPSPGEPLAYPLGADPARCTFAVAATFAGLKPGREILVLQAQDPAGAAGLVDALTDRRSAADLLRRLKRQGDDRHFQMLLRVWLDRGAAVKTEYVTHHEEP